MVNKGPLFYLMFNLRIFWKLIFSSFDVIHAVDLDTLPAAYFACKLKGKKLVYDSHEYFTEVPELIERPVKRAVWLRLEAYLIPKISNALTVSQGIAEAYYEKYRVAFEVIRNCPVSFDLASKKKDKKYLLYQGALNKGRGLEATIEAMQDLPILLYIAGNGDIKEELVRHVAELKLEDKVIFLGELKRYKPAEEPLRKAVELSPENKLVNDTLANNLFELTTMVTGEEKPGEIIDKLREVVFFQPRASSRP